MKILTAYCFLSFALFPVSAQVPDEPEPWTVEDLAELRAETVRTLDELPDLDPLQSRLALMRMLDAATDKELSRICYGAEKEKILSDKRLNLAVRLSGLQKGKDVPAHAVAQTSAEPLYRDGVTAKLRVYDLMESADDRQIAAMYRGASKGIELGRVRDRVLGALANLRADRQSPEVAASSALVGTKSAARDHPCTIAWQICTFQVPDVCPPGETDPTCGEIHRLCETLGDWCGWGY